MNFSKNKTIELFILVPLVIAVVAILYYSFIAYGEFKNLSEDNTQLTTLQNLDDLLIEIDKERGLSAIYLAKNDEKDIFEKLKTQQVLVDKKINALISTGVLSDSTALKSHLKEINDERGKVKLHTADFNTFFFDKYTKQFSYALLDKMNKVKKDVESQQENIEFYNYLKMFKLDKFIEVKEVKSNTELLNLFLELANIRENSAIERGFVSYKISQGVPMENKDYEKWDTLIGNDYTPQIDKISDVAIKTKLRGLFNQDIYMKNVNSLRAKVIIASSANLLNTINNQNWFDTQTQKIDDITQGSNFISSSVGSILKENIAQKERQLTVLGVSFLLLILLIFIIHKIFTAYRQSEQEFKEAIEDISLNLNDDQRKELNTIIEKQEKVKIYNFMANTIADSNRTKDLFLANMSHEIRTPLNGIVGFTQLLKSTNPTEEQVEFINIIENSSDNLLVIVNDILDLAKIQENKVDLEEIEFNPFEIFESAIESYGARADEKQIELQLLIDPEINTNLIGDPTKITQVVVNLISNAIKFTPENGVIDVGVEKTSSYNGVSSIKFSVKDTGIGVSDEQKENIFKAFSQEDISTNRKFGGTGLGLTISTKLIGAMGGTLDIYSVKDEGATFFFELKFPEASPIETIQNDLTIGFYMPSDAVHMQERENVKKYIEHTGATFVEYNALEEVFDLDEGSRPDILFVDRVDIHEINKHPESMIRIVYIAKHSALRRKADKSAFDKIDAVVYKPINFSKTKRAINDVQKIDKSKEQASPEVEKETVHEDSEHFKFKNLNMLVAEDNVINQKLIEHSLHALGITLTIANNGEEAFNLRKERDFDIIFMDVQMPIMDGVESTHAILEYEKLENVPHVPIIALTANNLKGDRERLMNEGMDEFLSKPIDLDKMRTLLKSHFPDKVTYENNLVDIILLKENELERKMFVATFEKMGYTVDAVGRMPQYNLKIKDTIYKYSFMDATSLVENQELSEVLREKQIKNILFVDKPLVRKSANHLSEDFDCIIPNIVDMSLLNYYISKL